VLWRAAPRGVGALPPALAATVGLATQLGFTAIEASLGAAAWNALGRQCRWAALAPALLTASVAEAMSVSLVAGTPPLEPALRAILAGTRALPVPPADPLGRALSALGLLTLLRLGLAARAHVEASRLVPCGPATPAGSDRVRDAGRVWSARGPDGGPPAATPVSGREALALVLAFHLATRLAMWWSLSLLQGRSFETWGDR